MFEEFSYGFWTHSITTQIISYRINSYPSILTRPIPIKISSKSINSNPSRFPTKLITVRSFPIEVNRHFWKELYFCRASFLIFYSWSVSFTRVSPFSSRHFCTSRQFSSSSQFFTGDTFQQVSFLHKKSLMHV